MWGWHLALRENRARSQPRNGDAYKMSKIVSLNSPRTAIAARKLIQAIENTRSFSRSELALRLYTMAHRLLRLSNDPGSGVQSAMARFSQENPARVVGRMPVLIGAARD
jgi:hypothetical protein